MSRVGRSGNYFRSFTFEEGQYGICFHCDGVVAADYHGADYRPFLDGKNGTKDMQTAAGNGSANTVLCGITSDKLAGGYKKCG